jgi:predicted DNA-binding transcriptional regulator YafY
MTTIREQLETLPCSPQSRYMRQHRINGIEDYLFIRGDRLSAARAAERLGVTKRTVERWRAFLRHAAGTLP